MYAPRLVADRSVGLPVQRADIAELAALEVEDRGVFLHSVVLVIDDPNMVAIFERSVVVERGEASQVCAHGRLADPPVEVHDVGMIFLDDFGGASQPVRPSRLARHR